MRNIACLLAPMNHCSGCSICRDHARSQPRMGAKGEDWNNYWWTLCQSLVCEVVISPRFNSTTSELFSNLNDSVNRFSLPLSQPAQPRSKDPAANGAISPQGPQGCPYRYRMSRLILCSWWDLSMPKWDFNSMFQKYTHQSWSCRINHQLKPHPHLRVWDCKLLAWVLCLSVYAKLPLIQL